MFIFSYNRIASDLLGVALSISSNSVLRLTLFKDIPLWIF